MSHAVPPKRIVTIRPRAVADIEIHADYLEGNATPDVTQRFRTAITDAVAQIGVMPGLGAPRAVSDPRLSGLRMWVIPSFRNYLLFYLTPKDGIEIVRVFHGAQDIAILLDEEN